MANFTLDLTPDMVRSMYLDHPTLFRALYRYLETRIPEAALADFEDFARSAVDDPAHDPQATDVTLTRFSLCRLGRAAHCRGLRLDAPPAYRLPVRDDHLPFPCGAVLNEAHLRLCGRLLPAEVLSKAPARNASPHAFCAEMETSRECCLKLTPCSENHTLCSVLSPDHSTKNRVHLL